MQHADARFERTQPAELRRIPFTEEEMNLVPGAVEAIGWAVLALAYNPNDEQAMKVLLSVESLRKQGVQ